MTIAEHTLALIETMVAGDGPRWCTHETLIVGVASGRRGPAASR